MKEELVKQRIQYLVQHGGLYPERSQMNTVIALIGLVAVMTAIELAIVVLR